MWLQGNSKHFQLRFEAFRPGHRIHDHEGSEMVFSATPNGTEQFDTVLFYFCVRARGRTEPLKNRAGI